MLTPYLLDAAFIGLAAFLGWRSIESFPRMMPWRQWIARGVILLLCVLWATAFSQWLHWISLGETAESEGEKLMARSARILGHTEGMADYAAKHTKEAEVIRNALEALRDKNNQGRQPVDDGMLGPGRNKSVARLDSETRDEIARKPGGL